MADEKQKMTSSYKAAFVFSIVMSVLMFVLYSAEYQTTHKASSTAIPFLLWCYQTWLIYKQQNAKLVGFYKAMLWIGGIALAILSLMLASNTDIAIYGFDAPKLIGIAVMLGIYYGLLQYFKQQLVNPSVTSATSNNSNASNEDYLRAEAEFNSSQRDAGLWVRCFAEADGNEAIAKARYIKSRAIQSTTSSITAQANVSNNEFQQSTDKDLLEKLTNTKNLLIVETAILLAILIAAGYFAMPVNKDQLKSLLGASKYELQIDEMLVKPSQDSSKSIYEVRGPDDEKFSVEGPAGATRRTVIDVIISETKDEDKAKWKDFK